MRESRWKSPAFLVSFSLSGTGRDATWWRVAFHYRWSVYKDRPVSHPVGPDYSASHSITYSRRLARQTHYYSITLSSTRLQQETREIFTSISRCGRGLLTDGSRILLWSEWGRDKDHHHNQVVSRRLNTFCSMSHQSFQSQAIHSIHTCIVQLLHVI